MTQEREPVAGSRITGTMDPPRNLGRILLFIGPGMILAANIVGSGELIATPNVSARTGYTLLWLMIFSCVIKTFFQIEIGRYALSTGRTTLDSFNSLPGPRLGVNWLCWCWLVMALCSIIQLGAMAGGVAQALRLAFPSDWKHIETLYAVLTGLSIIALLINGRYGRIEHLALGMVVIFTLITIYSVIHLQFTDHAIRVEDLKEGFSFHLPSGEGAILAAIAAFGITGVGGSELVAYPYWCLEKGYGRAVGTREAGGEAAWAERAKGWIRVMQYDAWLSTIIFTVATVAFFLLGAAILHPRGIVPAQAEMVDKLKEMYVTTFGVYAKYIFLLGAICVLYSTFFTATAGNARMLSDWAGIIGVYDRNDPRARHRLIMLFSVVIPIVATAIYLGFGQPVTFVIIGGVAQALMLPLIGLAVMYYAYDGRIDRRLLGGFAWFALLAISFVLMFVTSAYGGYEVISRAISNWFK
jgi:Mn2+/Fe2+ NRAMP family transporter